MSSPLLIMLVLTGASCLYLSVVAWSFRATTRRNFPTPWLLLPVSGAAITGLILAFGVPILQAPALFKLFELGAHLCNILLIWTIAGKLIPTNRLPATLLYAWNPLVLIELTVYANTAGVVICLLLLALLLLLDTPSSSFTRIVPPFRRGGVDEGTERGRRKRPLPSPPNPRPYEIAALVLVGLAMRINFMTLLIAPLLLWFMARHLRGVSAALTGFMWRALVVLAIFIVAYLPDWQGSATFLAITNGLHLFDFANSPLSLIVVPMRSFFSFVALRAHFPPLMQPTQAADMTLLATSFFLFALLYMREMGQVRAQALLCPLSLQDGGGRDSVESGVYDTLFTGWIIVMLGYVVLGATVFLPGYIVWGVWVVALRRFDILSVCVLLLSCSALLYYPLQQLASTSTGFLVPLCVFGIPLVYLIVQCCIPAGRIERKNVPT